MPYTKSIFASVTDRIDMLWDVWEVLKRISEEDNEVFVGMTRLQVCDRRWKSMDFTVEKRPLTCMSKTRKENHVRLMIRGENQFFWSVARNQGFERIRRKYDASFEFIKAGDTYIPPIVSECKKSVWEKCVEQLKRDKKANKYKP